MKRLINMNYVLLAFGLLTIAACRTREVSLAKYKATEHEATHTNAVTQQNETGTGSRVISISDSTEHTYRVNIFPVDSFSFSIRDGFSGKASKMEVFGSIEQRNQVTDSTFMAIAKQNNTQYKQHTESDFIATGQSKSLRKIGFNWVSVVLPILTVLGVLGGWKLARSRY